MLSILREALIYIKYNLKKSKLKEGIIDYYPNCRYIYFNQHI